MKSKFLPWLVVLLLFVLFGLAFFWPNISDRVGASDDDVWHNAPGQERLAKSELAGSHVIFVSPHRNLEAVKVADMRVDIMGRDLASISIQLSSSVADADYPALKVLFLNQAGGLVRTEEFQAAKYPHGQLLTTERISLPVDVKPGESKFSVQAFYPDEHAAS